MIPQSYQKVAFLQDTFFQWCNDAVHICCDICAGKVIFWKVRISFCLCFSWSGCRWITCWDWLHDRGQIKWVLWLAWTATLERNRCCSLAHTDVPISAEACYWRREDTTALRGSCWCRACLWARMAEADGGEGERGRGRYGENRPPGSWASKAGLTESIWTTVNRRQPVCWLPLSCIFTGSFPTNTHRPARLSKRSFSSGFSTK